MRLKKWIFWNVSFDVNIPWSEPGKHDGAGLRFNNCYVQSLRRKRWFCKMNTPIKIGQAFVKYPSIRFLYYQATVMATQDVMVRRPRSIFDQTFEKSIGEMRI